MRLSGFSGSYITGSLAVMAAASRARARSGGLFGSIAGADTGSKTSWFCVPVRFSDLEAGTPEGNCGPRGEHLV
jgi:hypothetical protein